MIIFSFPGCEGDIFDECIAWKCEEEEFCLGNGLRLYNSRRWINDRWAEKNVTEADGMIPDPLYPYNLAYYLSCYDIREHEGSVNPLDFDLMEVLSNRFSVDSVLCYPDKALKEEYSERLKNNELYSDEYVRIVLENWDKMIDRCNELKKEAKIELKAGETLADRIKEIIASGKSFEPDSRGYRNEAIQTWGKWIGEAKYICGLFVDTESSNGESVTYKYAIPDLYDFNTFKRWFDQIVDLSHLSGVKIRVTTLHNDIVPRGARLYVTQSRRVFEEVFLREIAKSDIVKKNDGARNKIEKFIEDQKRTRRYREDEVNESLKGAWAIKNYCKSNHCGNMGCMECVYSSSTDPEINPRCVIANTKGDMPKDWPIPMADYEDEMEELRVVFGFLDDPGNLPF